MIEIAAVVVIGLIVIPIGTIVAMTICAATLVGLKLAIERLGK